MNPELNRVAEVWVGLFAKDFDKWIAPMAIIRTDFGDKDTAYYIRLEWILKSRMIVRIDRMRRKRWWRFGWTRYDSDWNLWVVDNSYKSPRVFNFPLSDELQQKLMELNIAWDKRLEVKAKDGQDVVEASIVNRCHTIFRDIIDIEEKL